MKLDYSTWEAEVLDKYKDHVYEPTKIFSWDKSKSKFESIEDYLEHHSFSSYENEEKIVNINNEYFLVEVWNTSGYSGGNCWGDEARYYDSDVYRENKLLDDIISLYNKNVPYLTYRDIVVRSNTLTHTQSEYYGNLDNFGVFSISLKTIYEKLILNE